MRVSNVVEHVLMNNKQSRNSDKELILQVWEFYGLYLSDQQKQKFRDLPSIESIRRVRQKFQEQGKYPADMKIARERQFKSLRMQQYGPKLTPKVTEDILEHTQMSWDDL